MHPVLVEISEEDYKFLLGLQKAYLVHFGFNRRPTMSRVVQGVIKDYQQVLWQKADPDLLNIIRRYVDEPKVADPDESAPAE